MCGNCVRFALPATPSLGRRLGEKQGAGLSVTSPPPTHRGMRRDSRIDRSNQRRQTSLDTNSTEMLDAAAYINAPRSYCHRSANQPPLSPCSRPILRSAYSRAGVVIPCLKSRFPVSRSIWIASPRDFPGREAALSLPIGALTSRVGIDSLLGHLGSNHR